MNAEEDEIFSSLRREFIKTVEPRDLLPPLLASNVITVDDYERIGNQTTRPRRAVILVEILQLKLSGLSPLLEALESARYSTLANVIKQRAPHIQSTESLKFGEGLRVPQSNIVPIPEIPGIGAESLAGILISNIQRTYTVLSESIQRHWLEFYFGNNHTTGTSEEGTTDTLRKATSLKNAMFHLKMTVQDVKQTVKSETVHAMRHRHMFEKAIAAKLKRILLIGQAGMGKSHYANNIAFSWSSNSDQFLNEVFQLVILLPLRDLTAAQTFGDCLSSITSKNSVPDLLELLSDKDFRSHVLFILDGFDEMSVNISNIPELERIMNGEQYPESMVITTSRTTHFKGVPKQSTYLLVETLGYSTETVEEIVGDYAPSVTMTDLAQKTRENLQIPLFLTLFVATKATEQDADMYDLIEDFAEMLFSRYNEVTSRKQIQPSDKEKLQNYLGWIAFKQHPKFNPATLAMNFTGRLHSFNFNSEQVSLFCRRFIRDSIFKLSGNRLSYEVKNRNFTLAYDASFLKHSIERETESLRDQIFETTYVFLHQVFTDYFAAKFAVRNCKHRHLLRQLKTLEDFDEPCQQFAIRDSEDYRVFAMARRTTLLVEADTKENSFSNTTMQSYQQEPPAAPQDNSDVFDTESIDLDIHSNSGDPTCIKIRLVAMEVFKKWPMLDPLNFIDSMANLGSIDTTGRQYEMIKQSNGIAERQNIFKHLLEIGGRKAYDDWISVLEEGRGQVYGKKLIHILQKHHWRIFSSA